MRISDWSSDVCSSDLWYGIVATAEVLVTDTKTGLYYDSLNLGPGFIGPDGRELHWNPNQARFSSSGYGRDSHYDYVYLLKNTNKGKSQQRTVDRKSTRLNSSH